MSDPFALRGQSVFVLKGNYGGSGVDGRKDFAIISAAQGVGQTACAGGTHANDGPGAPHLRLRDDLLRLTRHSTFSSYMPPIMDFMLGDGVLELLVCSPDFSHREPAWATNLTLAKAVRVARQYAQASIFWCTGGQLHLVDTRGEQPPARPSHLEAAGLPRPELIAAWSSRVKSLPQR